MKMNTRKRAGHLVGTNLSAMFNGCLVACGRLIEDVRGEHADGSGFRDYSGEDIRTSYIERMEYVDQTDTTIIYTRNSIYFAPGNLLKEQLDYNQEMIEGKDDIRAEWDIAQIPVGKRFRLNEEGTLASGELLGAEVVVNFKFRDHELCGPCEVPFSLVEDEDTDEILKVVFLNLNTVEGLIENV